MRPGVTSSLLILAVLGVSSVLSAVFTVDYGSENIKVAVVDPRPGMSPINIAINEMSKRRSPALVAISNGERLLSEEAAGIVARYPERVYSRARDLVGRPAKDLVELLKDNYYPYQVSADEDRSTLLVRSHDQNLTFHAEEFVALILDYARNLANGHSKKSLKDAVISIPPFFSQSQRQAILDAADIAELNVMSLIHEHTAVAIQYGIDKDFSNGTQNVLFYDMGANSVYAAIVQFSAYSVKERGKNVSVNQFQVKALSWDAEVGGQTLELRLLEHFADKFNSQAQPSEDVRSSYKAMAKLKKQVKRTKEVLSANTEALLSVESLFEDKDFRVSVTREQFEELCEDLWERAVLPVQQVLADAKLAPSEVHAVELVGGSTRVPRLQAALSAVLQNRTLDRHLDADEAVALGASLLAANLSDGFKLNRRIGMVDGLPYGVQYRVHLENPPEPVGDSLSPEEELFEAQPLFPKLKRMPSKSTRHLRHLKDDFALELMYELEDEHLPVPLGSRQIALLEIQGLSNATLKYSSYNLTSPLRVSLSFFLSRNGLVGLERAEAIADFWEWVEVAVEGPPPPLNASESLNDTAKAAENRTEGAEAGAGAGAGAGPSEGKEGNATVAGSDSDSNSSTVGAEEKKAEVVYEKKLRRKSVRVPLKVEDVSDGIAKKLPAKAVKEGRERLALLEERERKKRETAEAKNSLEAHVYSAKDKLEADEDWQKVSTSAERSNLLKQLEEAEEWLYSGGESAEAEEFRSRLRVLQEGSQPIAGRAQELTSRPAAVEEASKFFGSALAKVEEWKVQKPWINATDKAELVAEIEAAKKWLEGRQKEQKKKRLTEKPAFESATVGAKWQDLRAKLTKLDKTPKPKPKPKAKPDAKNETASNKTEEASGMTEDKKPEEDTVESKDEL